MQKEGNKNILLAVNTNLQNCSNGGVVKSVLINPCVSVAPPGLKPNARVWRTDAPALLNRKVWLVLKPINAATPKLGTSYKTSPCSSLGVAGSTSRLHDSLGTSRYYTSETINGCINQSTTLNIACRPICNAVEGKPKNGRIGYRSFLGTLIDPPRFLTS